MEHILQIFDWMLPNDATSQFESKGGGGWVAAAAPDGALPLGGRALPGGGPGLVAFKNVLKTCRSKIIPEIFIKK